MFVQDFVDIPVPVDVVVEILTDDDGSMGIWAASAYRRGERMALGVGQAVNASVEFERGDPVVGLDVVSMPITWQATNAVLFPRMDAELNLVPIGSHWSHVGFRGRYRPPLEGLGKLLDRLAFHRIAEATVHNFLDRLGEALITESRSRTPVGVKKSG